MSDSQIKDQSINLAMKILDNERDRLIALFSTIMDRITPMVDTDPEAETDVYLWRLGEIMEERLCSTRVFDCVRTILEESGK